MRIGATPVPIPNTMVKTDTADNTWLETAWEDKWLPDLWGYSSVGRAPALQAGGHEFESRYLHSVSDETEWCTLKTAYKINQFSNIEIRHPRWLLFLRVTRTFNTSRQRSKKTNLKLPTHATLCMCEPRKNTTEGDALKRLAQKSKIFSLSFASQMSARFACSPQESKLSVNNDKLSPAFKASWLCYKERRVDALALRADERRDKLRKASGRSKYPLIRRYLNGETRRSKPPSA